MESHSKALELAVNNKKQTFLNLIDLYQSEIDSRKEIFQESKDANFSDQILIVNELFRLNKELTRIKNELAELRSQKQTNTQTITDFTTETKEPKILFIIILSLIFGFITSIFLVLIRNFVKSYKERQA